MGTRLSVQVLRWAGGASLLVFGADKLSQLLESPGVAGEGLPRTQRTCSATSSENRTGLIVVYGASGPTGSKIVKLCLQAGYKVRAFVRNQQKLQVALQEYADHEKLEVVKGDLNDLTAVKHAVHNAQAVISTAGAKPENTPGPMCDAIPAMVAGCREFGVRKLIVQTGALSQVPGERWRLFSDGQYLRAKLKYSLGFTTLDDNDKVIRYLHQEARDLDWVVSRPPGIMEAKSFGNVVPNVDPFRPTAITYIDLARSLDVRAD